MSDLKEYEVNGSTFQLSDEDAKRLGAKPVTAKAEAKEAKAPANKARTASNK